jgi:hypothetical protein
VRKTADPILASPLAEKITFLEKLCCGKSPSGFFFFFVGGGGKGDAKRKKSLMNVSKSEEA